MIDIKIALNLLMVLLFGLLSLLLIFKGVDKRKSRTFNYFVISMMLWAFGIAMFYSTNDPSHELFWSKFLYMAGGLVPPSFLYYALVFMNSVEVRKKIVLLIYSPNFIMFILYFFTPFMITSISRPNGIKTFQYGSLHLIWEISFGIVFYLGFAKFLKFYKCTTGIVKEHIKYIFLGTLVGVLLASITNVITPFLGRCEFVWLGPSLTSTWLFCITYTLLKYRIIDLRLAVTNITLFIVIYALVLGVPFYFYAVGYKLFSLFCMLGFATVGPFVYFYIQKRAEDKILEDQRRYQTTLRSAAAGMNRVREADSIFKLIVDLVTSGMQVEHTVVYAFERETDTYVLRAARFSGDQKVLPERFPAASALTDYLREYQGVVAYDDMTHNPQINEAYSKDKVTQVLDELGLRGVLILPVIIDDQLQSMIVLGKKQNGRIFSKDDLAVLMTLANQTALAVENCLFMRMEKDRLTKEGAQVRRESLDMMVGTIAHEIDNPITYVIGEADFLDEIIQSGQYVLPPEFLKIVLAACKQIKDGAVRVSKIVRTVEDYSKAESGEYKAVYIANVLIPYRSFLLLLSKQYPGVTFEEEIEPDLPPVWAEEVTIEEILFNFTENAFHATSRHNPVGQRKVKLRIYRRDDYIRIEMKDNGYGIEPKVLKQLFQVPTTTKGSTEGTGLGLYRVRKIVDKLKGRAWAESEGKGKGATFFVELPIYKGDPNPPGKKSTQRIF